MAAKPQTNHSPGRRFPEGSQAALLQNRSLDDHEAQMAKQLRRVVEAEASVEAASQAKALRSINQAPRSAR